MSVDVVVMPWESEPRRRVSSFISKERGRAAMVPGCCIGCPGCQIESNLFSCKTSECGAVVHTLGGRHNLWKHDSLRTVCMNRGLGSRNHFACASLSSVVGDPFHCNASSLSYQRSWWGQQSHARKKFSDVVRSAAGNSDDEGNKPHQRASEEGNSVRSSCMHVRETVLSGKTIEHAGTVIVFGAVNRGGTIMADGDVLVLGRLQGKVHAGRSGDNGAVIYASELESCEVSIAGTAGSKRHSALYPSIASLLEDNTIGIHAALEGCSENKPVSNPSIYKRIEDGQGTVQDPTHPLTMDQKKASQRPAQMALFTGLYIFIAGLALLLFPTSVFGLLFDVRSVTVGWIRVGAILAAVFGVYYIGTAVGDMRGTLGASAFYMSTVVGRMFLFFGFCWLVAIGAAQPGLLLVGGANMIGAMLMLMALRQAAPVPTS